MKVISETWSVSLERIQNFLLLQGAEHKERDRFVLGRVEIVVKAAAPRKIGRFSIPGTLVEFRGEDSETDKLYHSFFLNFISAGA